MHSWQMLSLSLQLSGTDSSSRATRAGEQQTAIYMYAQHTLFREALLYASVAPLCTSRYYNLQGISSDTASIRAWLLLLCRHQVADQDMPNPYEGAFPGNGKA